MAANSLTRRILKTALSLLPESAYRRFQAAAKTRDIRSGLWSEPELKLIPHAVLEGEIALDIGANMGLYSYYLSKAVGKRREGGCFRAAAVYVRNLSGSL